MAQKDDIFVLRDGAALLGAFVIAEVACEAASKLPSWQVSKPALPVIKTETVPHKVYEGGMLVRNTYSSDDGEFVRGYDVIPLRLFENAEDFLAREEVINKGWENYKG